MASFEFKLARRVSVAPFVADANPNLVTPAAGAVFSLPARAQGLANDLDVKGHSLYIRFLTAINGVEVPLATADFTTWVRDSGATAQTGNTVQRWTSIKPELLALSSALYVTSMIGDLFVQLTAVGTVGTATIAEIWIAPRISVASA